VLGVLVYNHLQERSARREAERSFKSAHADVLSSPAEERREPSLGLPPLSPPGGTSPDPAVDYVMELQGSVDDARLHEGWKAIESRFGRRALLAQGRVALQMVSRDGVVSDAELLEFRSEVETLAASLGAKASGPEMRVALEAARELDRACADADIQVALHVIGAVPEEELARLGEPAFRVERGADRVTLVLDVARTPEPGRSFEAMARAGHQLATAGGGRLADDNGNTVDERALGTIGTELESVRQSLLERGIEPGGPLALRLFS